MLVPPVNLIGWFVFVSVTGKTFISSNKISDGTPMATDGVNTTALGNNKVVFSTLLEFS